MEGRDGYDLALVSERAVLDGTFTEAERTRIQERLWNLLAERTQRYTMGDSSSVPVETARELLRSICFSIGLYLKTLGAQSAPVLKNTGLSELLRRSRAEIESQIATGRRLLRDVKAGAPDLGSRSYEDTLAGIGEFFARYDYHFFAHEIPCWIDYQLCHPVPEEEKGIAFINAYLRRLLLENEFCGRFETKTVAALLESCCPDYRSLLINLYEPVAVNAVGLALLEGDVLALDITGDDRHRLMERWEGGTITRLDGELRKAADLLCYRLMITEPHAREYLRKTAAGLPPRILATLPSGRLDGIFPSLFSAAR